MRKVLLGEGIWGRLRASPPLAHGVAVAAWLVATVLRLLVDPYLPPGFPFLTFFPAVILTAFVAGTAPGILCAALSGVSALYLFIEPLRSFAVPPSAALALGFYAFIVVVEIGLIHIARRALAHLEQERSVTARLHEQQALMFQELQHRVANNMAFIAGLLGLHRRGVRADPASAEAALQDATRRIATMGRIHRRLYDPAMADRPVGEYLREICQDLLEATGARNIVLLVDMPAIRLDIARLTTLSLLVTEVVTNSLKHAFVGQQGGTISLSLVTAADDALLLTIRDDGRGAPAHASTATAQGLGTRIVQSLADQLGGRLRVESAAGMVTQVVFPRASA